MSSEIQLTATSYVVLGLLAAAGEATSYELKQMAAESVANFWSVPHSQLYAEPARLAGAGYVSERREQGGRRRRHYAPTERGLAALEAWRLTASEELVELRDAGILRLFFGADPGPLARAQLPAHRRRLAAYQEILASCPASMVGPRLALEAGIGHEREYVRFWAALAGEQGESERG